MDENWKSLGQLAYEAYAESTGGVSAVTGEKLPGWADQRQAIRDAWNTSAEAVKARLVEDQTRGDGLRF